MAGGEDETAERLRRFIAALEANRSLRELLDGVPIKAFAERAEGRLIVNITINNYGDVMNKEYKQNINAPVGVATQGDHNQITHDGPMFVGGSEAISHEQWKRDVEDVAWALAERHDALSRKLHALFKEFADTAVGGTVDDFRRVAEEKVQKTLTVEERKEAHGRLRLVAEGAVAGTVHAVAHKLLEWLGPILLAAV